MENKVDNKQYVINLLDFIKRCHSLPFSIKWYDDEIALTNILNDLNELEILKIVINVLEENNNEFIEYIINLYKDNKKSLDYFVNLYKKLFDENRLSSKHGHEVDLHIRHFHGRLFILEKIFEYFDIDYKHLQEV